MILLNILYLYKKLDYTFFMELPENSAPECSSYRIWVVHRH